MNENMDGLEAFKATLSAHQRREAYATTGAIYDVAKARYLFSINQHPDVRVSKECVDDLCKLMNMDYPALDVVDNLPAVHALTGVDDNYARDLKNDAPLLLVMHTNKDGRTEPLIIDGNHRLRHAFLHSRDFISVECLCAELALEAIQYRNPAHEPVYQTKPLQEAIE